MEGIGTSDWRRNVEDMKMNKPRFGRDLADLSQTNG